MRQTNFALVLLSAVVLAACGGSSGGDQALKTKFSAQVTFGDSLADVGTYNVGTVKAIGGGKYTINGDASARNAALTGKNWTELMAAQFGLAAPCPAQTGLDGDASLGFAVAVVDNLNCTGYAQGGARVTHPVGPGNKLTGSALGQLTVPVVTQVATHLARNAGKFKGDEVVFLIAGGNDALMMLDQLSAGATAAGQAAGQAEGARAGAATFASNLTAQLALGATDPAAAAQAIGAAILAESARAGSTEASVVAAAVGAAAIEPGNGAVASAAVYGPMVAQAQAAATAAGNAAGAAAGAQAGADYAAAEGPKLAQAMGVAGAELAAIVKTQIVAKGANFVVLNNLPDLGSSPSAKAQDANTQALIKAMVSSFNSQLKASVDGEAKILYVDLFKISHDQVINPGPYGLTNTSTPACGPNPLGTTALGCNAGTTISGDVSRYMFADDVHPTPFESTLIARYVALQMIVKGWL